MSQPDTWKTEQQLLLEIADSEASDGKSKTPTTPSSLSKHSNPARAVAATSTVLVIAYYAACSSTMLIINKVAIHNLPAPSFVLLFQLLASVVAVQIGNSCGWIQADALQWDKVRKFAWVVVGFLGTIYCNIKVLQHSNVETFITFRSSTPLLLSVCDWAFLGRTLPSVRSWVSVAAILFGAACYVMVDDGFKLGAYIWLLLWYTFFTFDTVYVKHMCDTVEMTNWGRVYYTNAMAIPPMLITFALSSHDLGVVTKCEWETAVLIPLLLSAVVGLTMSHSAYLLRDTVSATLFTVVGIVCKVVTVIINCLIWDKHGSPQAIGCLMICVVAGAFYEQAPKRAASPAATLR